MTRTASGLITAEHRKPKASVPELSVRSQEHAPKSGRKKSENAVRTVTRSVIATKAVAVTIRA